MSNQTTIAAFFFSLFCGSTAFAQNDDMIGVWVNKDADTRGIAKIAIQEKDGATSIRAFGKCHPRDCDLGSTKLHPLGDSVGSMTFPYGFASWDKGFKLKHLTIQLVDDELTATAFNIFKVESGRSNYRSQYTFRRAKGDEAELPAELRAEADEGELLPERE